MFRVVPCCDGVVTFDTHYYTYEEALEALKNFDAVASKLKKIGKIKDYYVELIKEDKS